MPDLNNLSDFDVFAPQIHRHVPGRDSIEITDAEAALFGGHGVFTVTEGQPAVTALDATEDDPAPDETATPAKRKYTKRGAAVAEVDSAPVMEKRG